MILRCYVVIDICYSDRVTWWYMIYDADMIIYVMCYVLISRLVHVVMCQIGERSVQLNFVADSEYPMCRRLRIDVDLGLANSK